MDLLDHICEKLGRRGADVYLDVYDYLDTKPPERVISFCCKNQVSIDHRSGRWIMPLASVEKVSP